VKQTYRAVAGLIALGVVVQAGAIAFGWFDALNKIDNGLVVDKNYQGNVGHAIHGVNGEMVIPVLGLILLIVSFFAAKEIPGARKWAAIVFGAIVLQVALAFVAFGAPIVGALHGVNALVVLGTAGRTSMLAREAASAGRSASGGQVSVPQQSTGPSVSTETSRPA
jgi:heme A synthase